VTLIELLVIAAILGILAAAAIPGYRKALERSYLREAQDLLLAIYSGQRAYFFMSGFYLDNPSSMAEWRLIHMDDPNITATIPVSFTVSAPSASTFTSTATRLGGGPCVGNTATINQDRTEAGSWPSCSGL